MNKLFGNSYQVREGNNNMGTGLQTKGFPFQSESLFGMALYDFDTLAADVGLHAGVTRPARHVHAPPPFFHPVDEYKDLSLKEILDLSDDFLSSDEDQLLGNCNNDYTLDPTPFANGVAAQFRSMAPTLIGSLDRNNMSHQDQLLAYNLEQQQQLLQQESQQQQKQQMQQPAVTTSGDFNPKKRSLEDSNDDDEAQLSANDDSSSSNERRFRPYQAGQWSEKFAELCEYKDEMGHCLVPHTYNENLALARWVKRQRYQYKLMMDGKSSTMTEDRVNALDEIGFVWDSQGAAWGERLGELQQFRQSYMHCNVPSNFNDNPRLATWIKCQRRQYKLYMEGKPSNMTPQRIQHLENLGFEWELRTYKKQRQN
jgi:Helicase associated domain